MVELKIKKNSKAPQNYNLDYTTHELSLGNKKFKVWNIPAKNSKVVVVLIHGYATVRGGNSSLLEQAKFLHDTGYSTILINPESLENITNKVYLGAMEWKYAKTIYEFVRSLPENKNKKIGFLGDSMGAVTSIILIGKTGYGDFVVAGAPFSSYKSLFSTRIKNKGYPEFLIPLIYAFIKLATIFELRINLDVYSPDKFIAKIKVPILIISAEKDIEVNKDGGKILFEKANSPKEFWHTNTTHSIFEDDRDEYKKKILWFLKKCLD